MAYGILFLRIVVGSLLFAHGAQKLFGWFGGHGLRGTAGFFDSLGFRRRHALPMAVLAGVSEAAGALLVLGFLTPLACAAIATVMVVAVGTVHWRNGLWNTGGGYEFNLVLWAVAVAIAASGPGRFSLDGALYWAGDLTGLWWGVGVLFASLVSGFAVLALRETRQHDGDADDADAGLSRAVEHEREETFVTHS